MTIESEDFEAWLAHPVTQAVMARAQQIEQGCKAAWMRQSWDGGTVDAAALAFLRGKAAIAKSFAAMKYEDIFKQKEEK